MKKLFILVLCVIYGFATSPLVHGFCVEQNQEVAELYGCHDTGETQEDCLSSITNAVQAQDITLQGNLKQLSLIPQIILFSCTGHENSTIPCFSSYPGDTTTDWWERHVGTLKKLE